MVESHESAVLGIRQVPIVPAGIDPAVSRVRGGRLSPTQTPGLRTSWVIPWDTDRIVYSSMAHPDDSLPEEFSRHRRHSTAKLPVFDDDRRQVMTDRDAPPLFDSVGVTHSQCVRPESNRDLQRGVLASSPLDYSRPIARGNRSSVSSSKGCGFDPPISGV